jgi:hypothetical protein
MPRFFHVFSIAAVLLLVDEAYADCGIYAFSVFAMNDLASYAAVVNQKTLGDLVIHRVESFQNKLETIADVDSAPPDSCFIEGEASGVVVFSYKESPECDMRHRVLRSFSLHRPSYVPLPPKFSFEDLGTECVVKDEESLVRGRHAAGG